MLTVLVIITIIFIIAISLTTITNIAIRVMVGITIKITNSWEHQPGLLVFYIMHPEVGSGQSGSESLLRPAFILKTCLTQGSRVIKKSSREEFIGA